MNATSTFAITGLVCASVALAACGSEPDPEPTALPQASEHVALDPAEFTTDIDNRYWPMPPGSRWVYRETSSDGPVQRVVVTVTDRTRTLDGVEAREVRDVVTAAGEPVEVTSDYYAQDSIGNVWYLGEDTTEYENGRPTTTAGSFHAGEDGAEAGIAVPAEPTPGLSYRQEYYAGRAEDQGEVLSTGEQVEAPFGHFDGALMTRDTNPLEPRISELKLYAPGVGPVLALTVSGGDDREQLISYTRGG